MVIPPPNRSPARRAARAALVAAAFLLAGAVVSVGVAVGFGLWGTVKDVPGASWKVVNGAFVGKPGGKPRPDPSMYVRLTGTAPADGLLSAWNLGGLGTSDHLFNVFDDTSARLRGPFVHRTGWPLRALEYSYDGQSILGYPLNPSGWSPPALLARDTYDLSFGTSRPPIPRRPIPLGLAVDSAFFGIILFAVCITPGPARRALRRWRGRCPGCGYSRVGLGESACPECGRS